MTVKKSLLILLLISLSINAQRETDHWYFGYDAALRFNYYNQPTPLLDSQLYTPYGSATISSKDGELLFYTSGTFIYNKEHYKMVNGDLLASDTEVLQSSIIIPKPNDANIYYLITLKNSNNPPRLGELIPSGLYYSVIDISLNDGLGEVIEKNVLLTSLASEKLTAVHAKDGKSIWVISFGKETENATKFNTYFAYKIDNTGVNTTPVLSYLSTEFLTNKGALKASPNGQFLLASNLTNVNLTDFNNETGEINNSNFVNIAHGEGMASIESRPNTYGIEFSQDSEYFYVESIEKGENIIFQYNINDIDNRKEIYTSTNAKNYMQLAKDKKIYVTTAVTETIGGEYLSIITPPETKKDSIATYTENAIFLENKKSSIGLPNFIQSYFRSRIISESGCVGNNTIFNVDTYAPITSASWSFGDGTTSTEITPIHIYTTPGLYTATCTITINKREVFMSKEIEVFTVDDFTINNQNIIQCDVDNDGIDFFNLTDISESIDNNDLIAKMSFYTTLANAQNDIDEISTPTSYESSGRKEIFIRIYNQNNCYVIKSFFIESAFVELGTINSMFSCQIPNINSSEINGEFNLEFKKAEIISNLNLSSNISLRFYPDSHSAQINQNELDSNFFSENTTIWVRADTPTGCGGIEPFNVIVNTAPIINLQDSYTICFDPMVNPITLTADASNDSFEWRNSFNNIVSTNKDFTLDNVGLFSLTVYKTVNGIKCSNYKEFNVINPEPPTFYSVVANTEDKNNNTIEVIIDGNSYYEFSLDNNNFFGSNTSYTFTKVNPGLHTVYIRDINNCEQPTETNITVIGFKKFFTPNGDGKNDYWTVEGLTDNQFKSVKIIIFDRYGKVLHTITNFSSLGWDGTTNGKLIPSNNYWFTAEIIDINDNLIKENGNFSLIRN
ncbi:T9SS type B sorting domain-containing protein [Polaribacter sp. Asnod1-A03]|uniref:T9SS type B sorting domain-containing protein n=1 Tax=Polaribacter sp. Asnod1-A03 TaxID=3160581 RepID=UPI00386BE54A